MDLNHELDRVKVVVFNNTYSAFLGTLLCNFNFIWSEDTQTAGVDLHNNTFYWNPSWFKSLSVEERKGVLLHELWHIALLHGARQKNRDSTKWNVACDIYINNSLIREGITLPEGGLSDLQYSSDILEEQIYDQLPDEWATKVPLWGTKVLDSSDEAVSNAVSKVQQATIVSKDTGKIPGNTEEYLRDFLAPKVNWKVLLHKYLQEKLDKDYSWSRPNRRFRDTYLPSFLPVDGKLINIAMFIDTSSSIKEDEVKRFFSEAKYIKEVFNPELLSLIQFDTHIHKIDKYREFDRIREFKIKGRGGTSYKEVHQYIESHNPTLSIIFTDLYATPMDKTRCSIIWICSSNLTSSIGKTIHV